jgi:hypothetical protein
MRKKTPQRILMATVAVTLAVAAIVFVVSSQVTRAASPQEIDPSYANGTTVYMMGAKLITNPDPNLLATAPPLYGLAYKVPGGTTGPITLPSGYQPQCNPCDHFPPPFHYHDHILAGAPGFGADGTALDNKGPWKIIIMMYDPAVSSKPDFKPLMDDESIVTAEQNGEFLKINADLSHGPDPYQIDTGMVLICPLVSSHA